MTSARQNRARCVFVAALAVIAVLAPPRASAQMMHEAPAHTAAAPPAASPATAAAASELVPIKISPERRQLIGVTFATVERRELTDRIEATGTIEADEKRQGYVQLKAAGWVRRVFANQTYQFVRRGEPLLTIQSPDLLSAEREYLIALKQREDVGASTIEGVAAGAESLVDAAADRLRFFGVPLREIARLKRERIVRDTVEIDSPLTGYVTDRGALPDMYATPETKLFAITDLSEVWMYAAVFQDQIGEVKRGDPVTVTVDAYPGRSFVGTVDYIWPAIDMATRTARVRCDFRNPDALLKLGMFVHAAITPQLGSGLVIPDSGVLRTGTRNIAFVDRGDGYLRPVDVVLGAHAGRDFVVLGGLKEGDRIVSSANFLIDSESQLQAAIGSYAPPPPGASAQESRAPQASVELKTDPAPPKRGHNHLTITVRDQSGRPVEGAHVEIVFFMPAMPAMGMSALRANAVATERGRGNYEVDLTLDAGGSWQVTITVAKGGQQIASRELTVTATGPM
jgi:RND family efflux transporter MFP subunit